MLSVWWKIPGVENMEVQVACVDWHLLPFHVSNRLFSGIPQYEASMVERIPSEFFISNTQCDERHDCDILVHRNSFIISLHFFPVYTDSIRQRGLSLVGKHIRANGVIMAKRAIYLHTYGMYTIVWVECLNRKQIDRDLCSDSGCLPGISEYDPQRCGERSILHFQRSSNAEICCDPRSAGYFHLVQLAAHNFGLPLHCGNRGVCFPQRSKGIFVLPVPTVPHLDQHSEVDEGKS
jgi:hypothetical protein